MKTYYVIFREDNTIDTSLEKDFEVDSYSYIKTRITDVGILEYYAHNSHAEFLKENLKDEVI